MNLEEMFSKPTYQTTQNLNELPLPTTKISFQCTMPTFIEALDETLVPCCLVS